jgi:heptosyltransferase-1
MMRVLIVKTSSLGDVIHTLPALSDAKAVYPDIRFDWLVEEAFAEIPRWHPAVEQAITVAVRRWRKTWWQAATWAELRALRQRLSTHYDAIIDAQGLIKSALLSRKASGQRMGLDSHSAKEPLASWGYHQKIFIEKQQHAILRTRQLLAKALGYVVPDKLDYGLRARFPAQTTDKTLLFFHATTWPSKHWPEPYWVELAKIAHATGYQVLLPWHSEAEKQRATRIAQHGGRLLPQQNLTQMAQTLAQVTAVVGVDTGLSHLAAALAVPSVTLYGATLPALTGTLGVKQQHLHSTQACAPCFRRRCPCPRTAVFPSCYQSLSPETVWSQLNALILKELP